jgi:hypothetical protein
VSASARTWLKLGAAVLLAAVAVGFVLKQGAGLWQTGEDGACIWFYDQSERRLYALPNDTVPPHKGIGGKRGDGVRAVVVAFRGEQSDPQKRRIAYLETYAPELKRVLEQVRSAHAAHQKYSGPLPARDSDHFQTNTLVKRPEDQGCVPVSSPEGQRIQSEWRSWRRSDGQSPIVCVP